MAASIEKELQQLTVVDETDEHDVVALDCRTFFRTYTENGKTFSECLVENCRKKKLCGKQKFNMERHLTTIHQMKFHNPATAFPKKEMILKIRMSPAKLFRAYVCSLSVDGRPLASVNDVGMRMLVDPMLDAFKEAKVHLNLSVPTVKRYLFRYTDAVKTEIRNEIGDSIVHVKLDLATRMKKSILGVNVQFMKDDKIVVRTLSMLQTESAHTGEYLCALLMQILDEYCIKYSQVHTITTDNGKNVLKAVQLFGEMESTDFFGDDGPDLNAMFDDENTITNSTSDSDENQPVCEDDSIEANLDEALSLFREKTSILNGIRCAAHTLQLVLNVAMRETDYVKKLIAKCREIVKTLLTPSMLNLIRQQKLKQPKIDCLTRWSSTFYMLERLVELKHFYSSMISFMPASCTMTDSDWLNLDGILRILRHFESATKKLQADNFTVADFYCTWQELKMEMQSLSGVEFVDKILAQMEIRESDMMRNGIVYSCVFMDPRYRILLSEGINFFTE